MAGEYQSPILLSTAAHNMISVLKALSSEVAICSRKETTTKRRFTSFSDSVNAEKGLPCGVIGHGDGT